ncbi:MAG: TetR/AcrR family transcriptional regulator [Peptococcaceae bacterium]|nr:TetR/AcrR family transcriptional regulator [Peptococcaceae bacterium]
MKPPQQYDPVKISTKKRILDAALELFSRRGFSAVSVRDIAAAVGVRESALYKHFPSKKAVFDQLVTDYLAKSDAFMAGIHALPTADPAELSQRAALYGQYTDENFLRIGGSVFTDFLMHPDVLRFWRMVSIERFNNENLAKMWNQQFFEEPIAYQTRLFDLIISIGAMQPIDPSLLALEFYTPLVFLYQQALPFEPDGPEFARALELSNRHMRHFRETYAIQTHAIYPGK